MIKQPYILGIIMALLMGATAAFLNHWQTHQRLGAPGLKVLGKEGDIRVDIALPEWVLDYTSVVIPPSEAERNTLPADTSIKKRRYTRPNGQYVDLFAVMMGLDRTSIHQPQFCLTGQGFSIDETELSSVKIHHPVEYDVPVTVLKSTKKVQGRDVRGLLVYWFVADGFLTAKHWQRMWWMARELFRTGVLQRWSYVACFSACYPGQEEATLKRMNEFLINAVPDFQRGPSGTRSSGPAPARSIKRREASAEPERVRSGAP